MVEVDYPKSPQTIKLAVDEEESCENVGTKTTMRYFIGCSTCVLMDASKKSWPCSLKWSTHTPNECYITEIQMDGLSLPEPTDSKARRIAAPFMLRLLLRGNMGETVGESFEV